MCGIAGFVGGYDQAALERMASFLVHRGPDASGFFHDPEARVGFAHRRLSIVDVEGGQQPMYNRDRSIVAMYNGEIYNHRELRKTLRAKGYEFASDSDGEVIAHLYEEFGPEFVSMLRGMFAIAIWDQRRRRLLLVRDRFGIKPLYYCQVGNDLLFASEIKALLAVHPVREIDPQALDWYLSFRYVPEDRTLFRGIHKVLPAHVLEVAPGEPPRPRRYWELRQTEPAAEQSEEQWASQLGEHLREAVDVRLMSDVPLGAFLSGGIDSSLIVGLMSELRPDPVETFSYAVSDGWHNESAYAEIAARAFATSHHPLAGNCDDPDLQKQVAWYLDEPLGDAAVLPTYELSRLTRQHVTVALTGEGADELLGGYEKYKFLGLGNGVARFLPGAPFRALAGLLPAHSKSRRVLRFAGYASDRARAYMEIVGVFADAEKQQLYHPDLSSVTANAEPASEVVRRILQRSEGPTYLDDLMRIDVETWLPNDVLLKADRMSMAHSLEARVPFLDHPFAEFCVSIPSNLKLKGWKEKYVLRQAARRLLPDALVERKKHGFTVPMNRPGGAAGYPELANSLERRGWLRADAVSRLLARDPRSEFVRRQHYTLVALEAWAQAFLDPPTLTPPPAA